MDEAEERVAKHEDVLSVDTLLLEEVSEEDRPLVQNTIYAVLACKHPERLCTSWNVVCAKTHYIVNTILPAGDFDISLSDLELINSLSPLRITNIAVVSESGKCKLVVKILNSRQRVQLSEVLTIIRRAHTLRHAYACIEKQMETYAAVCDMHADVTFLRARPSDDA
eukprot:2755036-Rhodomonas_salina.3